MARLIAIDVDHHGLMLAAGTIGRGSLVIHHAAVVPESAGPLGPENAELLGAQIKRQLKAAGIAPAPALLAVPRDRIIVKEVRYPPVPPADEPGVVRFQALKDVAEGADELVFDYLPLPAPPGAAERRASVAFVRKDLLTAARRLGEAAGVKMLGLVPRPFAAAAALQRAALDGAAPPPEPADGPVAVALLHEHGGEFTVVRGGVVLFARAIPALAMADEQSLLVEFRRNLAVAAAQTGSEVQAIYVAETEPHGGWSARLQAGLGLPVYAFDPLAGVAAEVPASQRGRLLGAVGLLAAKAQPDHLPINFLQPRQPRRTPAAADKRRTRILIGVLAGIMLAGGLFAWGYLKLSAAERELTSIRQRVARLDEEIKQEEVNAKKLAAVEEFIRRDVNWLDEYYDQVARFPDIRRESVRMTQFEGVALPLPTDRERAARAAKPAARNAPPEPAANLTMTLTAENSVLPAALTDALNRLTRFYVGANMSTPGLSGGGSGVRTSLQQFIIRTGVAARAPADYVLKLLVPRPITEADQGQLPPGPAAKPGGQSGAEQEAEQKTEPGAKSGAGPDARSGGEAGAKSGAEQGFHAGAELGSHPGARPEAESEAQLAASTGADQP